MLLIHFKVAKLVELDKQESVSKSEDLSLRSSYQPVDL